MSGPDRKGKGDMTRKSIAIAAGPVDPQQANQVLTWMLEGNSVFAIEAAIRETYPGADPQPLMLHAARELIESSKVPRDLMMGWCFQATRLLFARMVDVGDFAGALRAIKQLDDLATRNCPDPTPEGEPGHGTPDEDEEE